MRASKGARRGPAGSVRNAIIRLVVLDALDEVVIAADWGAHGEVRRGVTAPFARRGLGMTPIPINVVIIRVRGAILDGNGGTLQGIRNAVNTSVAKMLCEEDER